MSQVKALVVTGYGINCEKEMAVACELAGASALITHAQKLLDQQIKLLDFDLICFPGGFAFGDELGAGKVLANRISRRNSLIEELKLFVDKGKCILGICNGFQLLVKLGLLPGGGGSKISLTYNDHSRFDNRWIGHKADSSRCIFTKDIDQLYLPIRHAEGKFVFQNPDLLDHLQENHQIVFRYTPTNPNGSTDNIAGICDSTGRILGMMAHPEAALYLTNHPDWIMIKEEAKRKKTPLAIYGEGFSIFKNAVDYLKGTK